MGNKLEDGMSEAIFTEENLSDGKQSLTLGPAYFSSRDFMRTYMLGLDDVDLAPQLKSFMDAIYSKVLNDFQNWLINNADSNIHDHIWRTVDEIVRGILSGDKWITDKYVLGPCYERTKLIAKIVADFPEDLKDARIADLEKENKALSDELAWRRRT